VESAEIETLNINASHLAKTRPAGATTGLTYSGELDGPLTLAMARAARVSVGDVMVLGGIEIDSLDLSIKKASVDLGGGISIANGSLALKIGQIREISLPDRRFKQVQDGQLSIRGNLALHSPAMSINDSVDTMIHLGLSGPEDALNGTGSWDFGKFTGNARSRLGIKFNCRDTGQLDVDMETNIAVGGGSVHARMVKGSLSADGGIGPITAFAHSLDPNTGCDSPVEKHIVAEKGKYWTDGICNRGWQIYSCRWESPEVSYAYHVHLGVRLLSANLTMTNPHLYLSSRGEVSVCNLGAVLVMPLAQLGGYSPGIDSPYPGLDNIVNGIIQIGFEPFQSVLVTGLGTGIGWFVSSAASTAGNLLCIGKPL
jgi:hypothetical protein